MQEVNILIIEENKEQAAILESTIKGIGYRVWVTSEPKEALALLRNNKFAVLITELRSAKMNGIEVTKQAHKASAEINVVVLTFYSFINSAIEAMEAGAYGYITKPLNTSEIRLVVGYAVERYLLLSSDKEKDYYAELAVLDGLTGLYNRRYFKEMMNLEFARLKRYASNLSLLMIDIDDFKNYNDTNGHPAGDELLRKFSKLIKDSIREMDVCCRYGGEEFVVVLPQTDKKGASIVAERMRAQANLYIPKTISIGISTFPEDASDISSLIEKADQALYEAKRTGKNRYCLAKK
jgi:diguanylate cyclase (GGDEF)-like protein